jgi:hypothetical protein
VNLLTKLLTECAHAELAEGRCTVDDVAARAERLHAELIEAESMELVRQRIKDIVKKLLRDLAEDEDSEQAQQALPGLKLPSAIAVRRTDDAIYYVRADMATWSELQAGLAEREQNIVRAVIRRDQFQETVDRLRPWMEHDPACTVAEALRRERGGA